MESGMQSKLVAELFLPIPEPSHMSGRVELGSYEFSSDHQVFYKHEGVGSGEYRTVASEYASSLPCTIGGFHSRVFFITSWDTCPISDFLHQFFHSITATHFSLQRLDFRSQVAHTCEWLSGCQQHRLNKRMSTSPG